MIPWISRRLERWSKACAHYMAKQLTTRAAHLPANEAHEVTYLVSSGFVKIHATGQSITQLNSVLKNRLNRQLRVVIRQGTLFVADGKHQNMVARETCKVRLQPCSKEVIRIPVACVNATRTIPGQRSQFQGLGFATTDLARFLEASSGHDAMTVQAGVWALTDRLTGNEVRHRLRLTSNNGQVHQAISERNIDEARRILEDLCLSNCL